MASSNPANLTATSNGETLTITGVLFGDVSKTPSTHTHTHTTTTTTTNNTNLSSALSSAN